MSGIYVNVICAQTEKKGWTQRKIDRIKGNHLQRFVFSVEALGAYTMVMYAV